MSKTQNGNQNYKERILVMNLGSTSSKIAVYDDENEIFNATIRHTKEELSQFDDVLDQFGFRDEKVRTTLEDNGIPLESLTAVVSRGGNILPCPHGAIMIDRAMIDYLIRPDDYRRHASLFGSMIAFDLHEKYGIPAYIYDAISTDEKIPIARISGMPEAPRYTVGHTLNTRAMAIKCAEEKLGKPFDECTFIVAHLGGGNSIRLFKNGINIDSVNDDEGNFSCERSGRIGAASLIGLCYSGKYTHKEMMKKMQGEGGLMAHLGTQNALEVEKMIAEGDEYAEIVYEALAFNVAKDIGSLATVVNGKVDRIILTGGVAYSKFISGYITEKVSYIAPVEIMAGEYEMEALAAGALRVLQGKEEVQNFGDIAAASKERISILPGLEPGTVPAKYFE